MRNISINKIGLIEHSEADKLMRDLQKKRIDNRIEDTLLICEHPEIVTIGPRAINDGIKAPLGYDSTPVDRGGGLTWHGPGQLIIYPIIKWDLEGESNVKSIISLIEQWVINALEKLGIKGTRNKKMQGVWINQNKICSIGLSFLRWTSRHGFTINCNTPSGRLEGVSGCGLGAETTTSLSALGYEIKTEEICESLISTIDTINRTVKND
ncbi:MAG: lipoyl(octanoyl) transferase LipB [Candidatus Poseidoniaceae archaeon]|jgi:lipoyl(octanoyl) transferase|nr:lipoyl(octanoyl) transferase LipB [Candidatus Poseidoniaceae archaeon]